MFTRLKKFFTRLRPDPLWERHIVVEDRDDAIVVTDQDGVETSVPWAELVRVEIHTTNAGPFGADVWWVLIGTSGTCKYPSAATGNAEVLKHLQELEGFDDMLVVLAMGNVGNGCVVCWERA